VSGFWALAQSSYFHRLQRAIGDGSNNHSDGLHDEALNLNRKRRPAV
jgi:hypothetical protein